MYENLIMNGATAKGIVKISDPHTGEVFVHQENAIHFGNISWAITNALQGSDTGHITHMVFGSGGTSIDSSGNISYRSPNTSNLQDASAEPYQPTYWEVLSATGNSIATVVGTSNFSDLVTTVLIAFGEPSASTHEFAQSVVDTATTTNETYIFDELALYTGLSMGTTDPFVFAPDGRMLTHVIFHPVQKASNRELQIEYTIRVQMGP
jgi:hypothetical protein